MVAPPISDYPFQFSVLIGIQFNLSYLSSTLTTKMCLFGFIIIIFFYENILQSNILEKSLAALGTALPWNHTLAPIMRSTVDSSMTQFSSPI